MQADNYVREITAGHMTYRLIPSEYYAPEAHWAIAARDARGNSEGFYYGGGWFATREEGEARMDRIQREWVECRAEWEAYLAEKEKRKVD